jgi:hypothetical protein
LDGRQAVADAAATFGRWREWMGNHSFDLQHVQEADADLWLQADAVIFQEEMPRALIKVALTPALKSAPFALSAPFLCICKLPIMLILICSYWVVRCVPI